jgi:eukaryotic-like serine/threonine-protein kinase
MDQERRDQRPEMQRPACAGQVDQLCDLFEQQCQAGQRPNIASWLAQVEPARRGELLRELLALEVAYRRRRGDEAAISEYQQRFPDHPEAVQEAWQLLTSRSHAAAGEVPRAASLAGNTDASDQNESDTAGEATAQTVPTRFGRYRIEQVLGTGGFGTVYRAVDPQLQRTVALKVPHRSWLGSAQRSAMHLHEARAAAQLKHPGLIAVYDVQHEGGSVVIVQEFVDGQDLSTWVGGVQHDLQQLVHVMLEIVEAVGYAHQQGLVHRDLKPANILVDQRGHPHVADFGLALRESMEQLSAGETCGTPAYMSPEQVRGETHRLDGRSDLWSLGVILYELLTGQRPFLADTKVKLFDAIQHGDPMPPRLIEPTIPAELERITLKCLAKRATDRYGSATELVEDLRAWLTHGTETRGARSAVAPSGAAATPRVAPKGLRSFDAQDADFFLDLLPGPRDREGLPESIRFWKTRIEQTDDAPSLAVGLLYGPSGCGKSSLIKAGLLPRLACSVKTVYVEASPDDTEQRLHHGLCKCIGQVPTQVTLPELMAGLREGRWTTGGRKTLVILDQFEQWLHARRGEHNTQLVQALRHCDGARLQALVLVRDDFWMPVSEFLQELEIRNLEGHNAAAVSLFDERHARRVLWEFGRAYHCLPDEPTRLTVEELAFLDQAIAGLSQDGKVICVRLALFADMLKSRPWTTTTLAHVGGTEGLGVTFLEETFSAPTAPAAHRYHQQAAQAVLQALLPAVGSDIKGGRQSYDALRAVSGYARRPHDFAALIQLLDSQLRLITPTASADESVETARPNAASAPTVLGPDPIAPHERYYQLTHDYLVPSLREWLTRKQKETRRGRAELRLAERSALWNASPENRQMPSWWEEVSLRWLTDRRKWTEPQKKMMRRAGWVHGRRSLLILFLVLAVAWVGLETYGRVQARNLLTADPATLPGAIARLSPWQIGARQYLEEIAEQEAHSEGQHREQLHARLATVSHNPSWIDPLVEELLTGKVAYVLPIRQQLRPAAAAITERLQSLVRDRTAAPQRRFRAALALADYVPQSETDTWDEQVLPFVAEQLLSSNAEFQPLLRDALRPLRVRLREHLERIFADAKATDAQRLSAANALADYCAGDVARLSQLLTFAAPEQFAVLYPLVAAGATPRMIDDLVKIADALPPEELGTVARIAYGQQRANAAVTMLRLGERKRVLPVFDMTDDPEALTQFIFRCRPRDVDVAALLDCLHVVTAASKDPYPPSARYALLLALGEFTLQEIPEARRESLLAQLADWYAHDPSSGVHGAAGWLLRQWEQTEIARRIDHTPVPYSPDREWFTLAITVQPRPQEQPLEKPAQESAAAATVLPSADASIRPLPSPTFYYTFIVFPAGARTIGSPADEPERSPLEGREQRHEITLTRPFALLDREITFDELIAFSPQYTQFMQQFQAQPTDAGYAVDWYDAVNFCRWLGEQSGLTETDQAYAAPESLDREEYPREPNPALTWAPRNWPLDLRRRGFRLPTEAEWEVAARAGVRTAYGFGSDVGLLRRFGWFVDNSGKRVHPPRELRPSIRGLFDLHGNLWEWTHDSWNDDFSSAVIDPLTSQGGSVRVDRGGNWDCDAAFCRTAYRSSGPPTYRAEGGGFRMALSPSGASSEVNRNEPTSEAVTWSCTRSHVRSAGIPARSTTGLLVSESLRG